MIGIVYYSLEGTTEKLAKLIAEKTGAVICSVWPTKPYPTGKFSKFLSGKAAIMGETPELANDLSVLNDCDTVIVGTPIWASRPAPPINTVLNSGVLDGKRIFAFTTSLGTKCIPVVNKMENIVGIGKILASQSFIKVEEKSIVELNREIDSFCNKVMVFENE